MPTFRTKLRTVEAVRWIGQPLLDLPLWAQDPRYVEQSRHGLVVWTQHGPVEVERGSWLILGDKEVYPCSDSEFQQRYEAVE